MQRFFNTAGPCKADLHYVLPPLERLDLATVEPLLAAQKYFILHAPRQTGKTTCLLALQDYLNQQGRYRCVYFNVESAQSARGDVHAGIQTVLSALGDRTLWVLKDPFIQENARSFLGEAGPHAALKTTLTRWCRAQPQPLVLLIDEVDAMVGDTLISFLRQLRSGYAERPQGFPQSIVLCGVRDVRDYRLHSGGEIITGGSAFNIKAKSLRLGDFSEADIITLYGQHTQATAQAFSADALAEAWRLTRGQPWLVNALAQEACFEMSEGADRSRPVTPALFRQAAENLILRRDTHLDQLADQLREERVRRVIEPILAGANLENVPEDDVQYLVDLGLLRWGQGGRGIEIANAIYKETLPRVLNSVTQASMPSIQPTWLGPDGKLDMARLMEAFVTFWRQHGQPLMRTTDYHEIAPHLVLMAFLQRVTNGEGTIEREYAIGSGRMDLCLRYAGQTVAMELKVWRDSAPDPLPEGLKQLDTYLSGLGLDTGWLVIFDRRSGQPPLADRTHAELTRSRAGRQIALVRA